MVTGSWSLRLVLACGVLLAVAPTFVFGAKKITSADQVAARIDRILEEHWKENDVQPASAADDATLLRRLSLDLLGRIPTVEEQDQFFSGKSDNRRAKLIDQLLESPEFPLHFGNVLDRMIQTRYSGNGEFVDYLRRGVRDSKSWEAFFREMLLGPWDDQSSRAANRFLDKRAKTSDVLAVDAARVFFGVDISCAKCHDHPLVDDWKQEHFYGMVAFFHRTTGGKGKVGERKDGEVTFLGDDGKEQVAKVMFLSGRVVDEPATRDSLEADAGADVESTEGGSIQRPNDREQAAEKNQARVSRREQLVAVALRDRQFFSRSFVNRMWQYFFGRGLVHPVDQMHSGNPPSVPGLLEWLADDFADSGYDLRRLISALVRSNAYQLSSRWDRKEPAPRASMFAAATLRPLTQHQLAFSILIGTGNGQLNGPTKLQSRVERYTGVRGLQRIEGYLSIEQRAAELLGDFDERRVEFQSSAKEALFMSNNPAIQALVTAGNGNLAERLGRISQTKKLVDTAVRTVLGRKPEKAEAEQLTQWFDGQGEDRLKASEQLVWALVASAEFRFNH